MRIRSRVAAVSAAMIFTSMVSVGSAAAEDPAEDPRWQSLSDTPIDVTSMDGRAAPNDNSSGMHLTRDGRYALWTTRSTNWADQDANGAGSDVLRRDLHTGELMLVSTNEAGIQADGDTVALDMTPDGRYVLFRSQASNLVSATADQPRLRVYRKDMTTGRVDLIDVDNAGTLSAHGAYGGKMSNNGRFVLFLTQNAFRVPDYGVLLYLRDVQAGTTRLVNQRLDGQPVRDEVAIARFYVSDDGRYVTFDAQIAGGVDNIDYMPEGSAFRHWGSHLTEADRFDSGLSFKIGIYRRDMTTGLYQFLSVGEDGGPAAASDIWTQTADGRYIFVLESGSSYWNRTLPRIDTVTGERQRFDLFDNEESMYVWSHPGVIRASDDGSRLLFQLDGNNVVRDHIAGSTYNATVAWYGEAAGISGNGQRVGVYGLRGSGGSAIWYPTVRTLPEGDTTPPIITGSVTTAPNDQGWYDEAVIVNWTVIDPEPSSGSISVPAPTVLAGDGRNQTAISEATCDAAGNCSRGTYGPISIDSTPPSVIVGGVTESEYTFGSAPTPTCTSTDELSGIDGDCTLEIIGGNTAGVGLYTVTATARDLAGNVATATTQYRVLYAFSGFLQPIDAAGVSVFKAGTTIPVMFSLGGADGDPVASSAPEWLAPQRGGPLSLPVDEAVYVVPPDSGTKFAERGNRWQYNWKAEPSAAGYYWRLGARLDDGSIRYVTVGVR